MFHPGKSVAYSLFSRAFVVCKTKDVIKGCIEVWGQWKDKTSSQKDHYRKGKFWLRFLIDNEMMDSPRRESPNQMNLGNTAQKEDDYMRYLSRNA